MFVGLQGSGKTTSCTKVCSPSSIPCPSRVWDLKCYHASGRNLSWRCITNGEGLELVSSAPIRFVPELSTNSNRMLPKPRSLSSEGAFSYRSIHVHAAALLIFARKQLHRNGSGSDRRLGCPKVQEGTLRSHYCRHIR